MKRLITALVFSAALLPAVPQASVVTYSLPDILTFTGYLDSNVSATYLGTGFGGMYNTTAIGQPAWVHLLGVEDTDFSRTIMQVDISGLAGLSIASAFLSFNLSHGAGPQDVEFTGFDGGAGALTYVWDATGINYGSVVAPVAAGSNSVDVTDLLAASVGAGDHWFGLHLQGTDAFLWTYTYTGVGFGPDAAGVRLTVDTATIPVPGTLALLGVALAGLGFARRRTNRSEPTDSPNGRIRGF